MARPPSKTKLQRFIDASASMKNDPDYPIFAAGLREGSLKMQNRALSFLQEKYMGTDAPTRGSVEAKAILELAKELSAHLKSIEL